MIMYESDLHKHVMKQRFTKYFAYKKVNGMKMYRRYLEWLITHPEVEIIPGGVSKCKRNSDKYNTLKVNYRIKNN